MKFVIQRVKQASVKANGQLTGTIEKGYLILIGVCDADTTATADKMIKKTAALRIFQDENGKTNLSVKDVNGALLLVSQFTLYADCKKGNRPSFIKSSSPEHANALYEYIIHEFSFSYDLPVQTGIFGADMDVSLINDGPFTIMLDSEELFA